MENREIVVPLLTWLIGGSRIGGSYNIYTASLGTDPLRGAIGQPIFNYRIWIEKNDEDTEFVKAAVYYGMSCFENQNEDEVEINIFEATNEGLDMLRRYLEEKAERFFESK